MLGVTGGYLFVLFLFSATGAFAGFIGHHIRASVGGDERPLWQDGLSGFFLRQDHEHDKRLGWRFGTDGWYDGLSDSNLWRYVTAGALLPLLGGLLAWEPGIAMFTQTCDWLTQSGSAPRFCPS